MKNTTREDSVRAFNEAAGNRTFDEDGGTGAEMQWNCFDEESEELLEAIENYEDAVAQGNPEDIKQTRCQLVKEWADAQVTLSNLAWYYRIPADPAFNRVHASNMSKLVDGKLLRRSDGKVLKPDTYKKPDMRGL